MDRSTNRRTQENPMAGYWDSCGNFTSVPFAVFYLQASVQPTYVGLLSVPLALSQPNRR